MIGWLLSAHIIGIVLWIGGLITLGRLLGVHSKMTNPTSYTELSAFETKSYWIAVFPGFLMTLLSGIGIMMINGPKNYLSVREGFWGPTFHIKLTLVAIIIVLDQIMAKKMRQLHKDGTGSKAYFMASHGIIGLFLIIIVVLVKTRLLA